MNHRKTFSHPLRAILFIVLIAVFVFSGWKILGGLSAPQSNLTPDDSPASKTIVKDGVEYFPRQDISVMMLAGIDTKGPIQNSGSYTNNGKADMVALLVFDETARTYRALLLNRDTMVNMPALGLGGKHIGSVYGQLSLAHTYGSGLEDSSENLRTAVSDLLNGITIDHYLTLNMDAIALMNGAVGGVTVQVQDDFSAIDPTLTKGSVKLTNEQAVTFIQSRGGVGDQMNLSRMERHKEYINGFLTALDTKLEASDTFLLKTYDSLADYKVTDCSATTLNSLVTRYADFTFEGISSMEGENKQGEEYMEFYPNETALEDLILSLFYSEKNL